MIESVAELKISGLNYPIYSLDFSWGGPSKASSVTVSYVNSSGSYVTPILNTENPIKIELGDVFSFEGFPVSYSESFATKGNTLNVTYWDTSVILDKIFVGLKGVHGQAPPNQSGIDFSNTTVYGTFNNMLLLGNYVDPCEGVTPDYVDPCNPCVTITEYQSVSNNNNQKLIDCEVARMTQILEVVYSFREFINGLKSKGVSFYNTPIIKDDFYSQYSGTAREVLNAWCEDIGMTYIWKNNSVYFVDLKSGISINDSDIYVNCALLDRSISKSIENVSANGVVLYFGADGKIETYSCQGSENSLRLSLIPITLKDLFWQNAPDGATLAPYIQKYYTLQKTGENSIIPLQIACVLSKYSRILRDLILMYEYYEVNQIDNTLANKDMPLIGMKIKEAWQVGSSTGLSDNAPELKRKFDEHVPESVRALAEKMGAGMAIIEYDPEIHEKFYNFESELADRFMGKYWMSFFSKGDQYNINSADGSVNYYDAGTPNTLPFIDLIPVSSQNLNVLFQNLIEDSAEKNKGSSHVGAVETTNPNSIAKSFLLMDRNASWEPTPQYDDIQKMNKDLEIIHPYTFEPFKVEGAGDDMKENEFYCLIFNKPGTFDLIDKGVGNHPVEILNENLIADVDGYITTYGLRSAQCKAYQVSLNYSSDEPDTPQWNYAVNLYMPPQSHDTFGSNYPGVTVIASKNGSAESNNTVFVEKREVIFGDVPIPSPQSVAINISYKDISSILSEILEAGGTQCQYNVSTIQSLIAEYYLKTSRAKSVEVETKSYTIGGLPSREISVTDGLSSFSLRRDQAGITSGVTFSNLPPIPKSEKLQDKEFQKNLLKRYIKKKIVSSQDKIIL